MKNKHYYVKDPGTGIIYRTVGFTNANDFIVYPKYLPDFEGNRGESLIKYKGINYPCGSTKFLGSEKMPSGSAVSIKFNSIFNSFVPMSAKDALVLYDPTKRLMERIEGESRSSKLLKRLILSLSELTTVNKKFFGLDASMLVGMDKEKSDIDLIVYGNENALLVRDAWEKLAKNNRYLLQKPQEKRSSIVQRRKSYSPLMTEEEIVIWEEAKISGFFEGVKFSIMPVDPDGGYDAVYYPTGQMVGVRVTLNKDEILFDPGIMNLQPHNLEIVYGPSGLTLDRYITFLPSRMGVFLRNQEKLFILGKIYTMKREDKISFAITQFPWDDSSYLGESYFVTKIERCNLQHMISSLLGLNFNNSYFTD